MSGDTPKNRWSFSLSDVQLVSIILGLILLIITSTLGAVGWMRAEAEVHNIQDITREVSQGGIIYNATQEQITNHSNVMEIRLIRMEEKMNLILHELQDREE